VLLLSVLLPLAVVSGAFGQSPRPSSASDIRESIDRLATVGSVLYVAAHPDDENTAFLAAMVHGRNVRAAYLSITRGEGGQNLIGPEQGDLLGMIRTQELLAARSVDGGEQSFTRAIDFGYSKTTEETLRFWGREEIVGDLVRVIRRFRPDVVVTRFTPELGGHGNHTASAALTAEAVRAAGDASRFPEQLTDHTLWSPRRLVWNVFRQGTGDAVPAGAVTEDLGSFDPVIGRSYTELAGEARTMHKSQGFGAVQNRSSAVNVFQHVWGDSARADLFDGVDLTWRRLGDDGSTQKLIDSMRAAFDDRRPGRSIPILLSIRAKVVDLPDGMWKNRKLSEVDDLIVACAGVWLDALAPRSSVVAGDSLLVTLTAVNRSDVSVRVRSWTVEGTGARSDAPLVLEPLVQKVSTLAGLVPSSKVATQPYWLRSEHEAFRYTIADPRLIGLAEGGPAFSVSVDLEVSGVRVERVIPVRHRRIDPVDGEVYRPVITTTPVHVSFTEPVHVFPSQASRTVTVLVKTVRAGATASVRLELPEGWTSLPVARTMDQWNVDEVRSFTFEVRPSRSAKSGVARATVEIEGRRVGVGVVEAAYDHIPHQTLHVPAMARLLSIPVAVRAASIGYVMGAGDDVAEGLRRLGCRVELLTDEALGTAGWSSYDAIVVGVRAFNTRPALRVAKRRFDEYVRNGGTVIVQYQTTARGESDDIAPVPLVIGRERVTEEDAPMEILDPRHRVMNAPNRIVPQDLDGWVQERGLYYASSWDGTFIPLLSANDAGEPPRKGGLLVAKIGRGHFVYTGLSFFRQIPAGVPGAYRLLANLVSLGRP
jgi:LmbE family N-acetylglucosaminyl deacetylase